MEDLVHVVRENTLLVLSAEKKLSPVLSAGKCYSCNRWKTVNAENRHSL